MAGVKLWPAYKKGSLDKRRSSDLIRTEAYECANGGDSCFERMAADVQMMV